MKENKINKKHLFHVDMLADAQKHSVLHFTSWDYDEMSSNL